MTERHVMNKKIENKFNNGCLKNSSIQTGNSNDLILYLSDNKSIRVYYSNAYKEIVLSFNFGSKSFIITKLMWVVFKKHFIKIDNLLND